MRKLNVNYIFHSEASFTSENIYDDSYEWRLDSSCDWCPIYKTCQYCNIVKLNEKRSCFIVMGDSQMSRYKVYLLKNNEPSTRHLNCFYTGKCYDK